LRVERTYHRHALYRQVEFDLRRVVERMQRLPYRCREHAFGELALIATRLVRAAWEDRVRSRNIASQNEHRRIGH